MSLVKLALASLASRRSTALLTVIGVALSATLLIGVERLRSAARLSFANSVSGVDVIVGPRGNQVALLLQSVFSIGQAGSGMSQHSFDAISALPDVRWAVPLVSGDSHRGYSVVGTVPAFFVHYRHGERQSLRLGAGRVFATNNEAVIGAEVARKLGYSLGDNLQVTHGFEDLALAQHTDHAFGIVGILAASGTPVDRTVYLPRAGMDAMHAMLAPGVPMPALPQSGHQADHKDEHGTHDHAHSAGDEHGHEVGHEGGTINAVLIGLRDPRAAPAMVGAINQFRDEPLSAVMPGVALQSLWDDIAVGEQVLRLVAALLLLTSMIGLASMTLAGLNERRREMMILRAVGAGPRHLFGLLVAEAALLACVGAIAGLLLVQLAQWLGRDAIASHFGLYLPLLSPGAGDIWRMLAIVLCGALAGMIPAWRACRQSVAEGLHVPY